MHVVIAGSSGFLGRALVAHLEQRDHRVTRLVRSASDESGVSVWDPYANDVDAELIAGADVVVNLAGSPTVGNPYSKRWATNLLRSRVTTTEVLARAIAAAPRPPAYVVGNGISYYGDRSRTGDPVLTETSDSVGDALFTRVTRAWQAAADPAVAAGARVSFLRTSPVIDRASPPLKLMLPAARLGGATRLGSGSQHFPIISLRDWVGATTFAVEQAHVSGPLNLCCPHVPTNAEFTRALADAVGRPAFLFVPAALVRLGAGPLAPEVLGSLRTRPAALLEAGFTFADDDVRDVLASAI